MNSSGGGRRGPSVAFLLTQLGAHAAGRFAGRVADIDLTPPQAGLLRLLAADPGRSQREVAARLGMPPTRFVPFADELEERGLIERRKNPRDRRLHALHLTAAGEKVLARLREVVQAHNESVCAALSPEERAQLLDMLTRMAEEQGLTPGVHPGYKWIKREE